MRSSDTLSRLICLWAAPFWTLLVFAVAFKSKPALAIYRNNYQLCGSELLKAGIPAPIVADACSASLYPRDLTICVTQIYQQTTIAAAEALSTCTRVRQPRDLATCVIYISNGTQNAASPDVLDNCRRSLEPVRFGECVVGLAREVDITADRVMATCIDGSDRPLDYYPPSAAPRRITPPLPDQPIPVPQSPN